MVDSRTEKKNTAAVKIQSGKLEITLCTGSRGSIERDGETHCKILPFLSIAQCLEGRYGIGLDGNPPVFLEQGGAFIAKPDQPQRIIHLCPGAGRPMTAQWCFFSAVYDGFLDIGRCLIPTQVLTPQEAEPFGDAIHGLREISSLEGCGMEQALLQETRRQALGFRILELLLKVSRFAFPEESYWAVLPAITLMNQTAEGERFRLEELAQACHMSVTGFTGLFRRLTGDSPMSFYRDRRLNQAATLLLTSGEPVGEISQKCGFYDQFHLSREFKRRYGVSPRQYRQDFYRQNYGKTGPEDTKGSTI